MTADSSMTTDFRTAATAAALTATLGLAAVSWADVTHPQRRGLPAGCSDRKER
jgi:hypothetical protein